MIYGDEIKRINDTYDGYITTINNKYDALKAEIESKEITEEYTITHTHTGLTTSFASSQPNINGVVNVENAVGRGRLR